MKNIEIRRVSLDEVVQLREIARQTFIETFSDRNTEGNMKKYLDEGFSIEKLTAELNNENSEFYFAEFDNNIIGYIKLNSGQSQTELKDDKAFEIERIYVLKEFQRRNAGQLLYEKATQIAREANADYIWLGVWDKNPRAMEFYKKNGFVEFDTHIFKLGNDEQTDIMMKLQLI